MRRALLPALLLGFLVVPGSLCAQGKKPERIGTGLQPASMNEDLQHGRLLEITLKGAGQKVKGTLVRVDRAADRLYVRTEPGTAPQAIARKDIEKVEKRVQFAVSKDNVKLVGTEADVVTPEIQVIEITNGNRRTVTYSGATLSSGERSMLLNMQAAENELARLEWMADRENQVLDNALALQAEQRKTQELLNKYQDLLNVLLTQKANRINLWETYGIWNGYWSQDPEYWHWLTQTPAQMPHYTRPMPIIQQGPLAPPPAIVVSQDALAKARQNVALAQSQAVFEQNRLVAVVVSDK